MPKPQTHRVRVGGRVRQAEPNSTVGVKGGKDCGAGQQFLLGHDIARVLGSPTLPDLLSVVEPALINVDYSFSFL